MQGLINSILRLGLVATLSQREAFIEKTAQWLERYVADPAQSEKLAKILAALMEDMKDNINMERIVNNVHEKKNYATKEDIETLQKALDDLLKQMQDNKEKE